LYFVEKEN